MRGLNYLKALVGAASVFFLVACGGTSNNSPTPVASPTPTATSSSGPTGYLTVQSTQTAIASQTIAFVVTDSVAPTSTVTFTYATANGTATAGTDYTAATGTATIAAGQTSTTVSVNTANSGANKNFTFTISAPANASLGATTVNTLSMHANPAFELVITTTPESGNTTVTTEADCVIPIGTATYGPAVACTNATGTVNTTVAIPEGRLFFGKLGFQLNVGIQTGTPLCARATFDPYYYLASNTNATFSPPWETAATDCTKTPTPAACYGGLVADIVTGFPQYGGVYFMPSVLNPSNTWTANSANSHGYGSNRFSVNNLTNLAAAISFTNQDAYFGSGAYHEYRFSCRDDWDQEVYAFTLTLTDVDIQGTYPNTTPGDSTINQFPDWDPGSWDR